MAEASWIERAADRRLKTEAWLERRLRLKTWGWVR